MRQDCAKRDADHHPFTAPDTIPAPLRRCQNPKAPKPPNPALLAGLQPGEKRIVARCGGDALDQPFHRRLRRHLTQTAAQRVDAVDLIGAEAVMARTGGLPRSAMASLKDK